jgi:hypothetical protein
MPIPKATFQPLVDWCNRARLRRFSERMELILNPLVADTEKGLQVRLCGGLFES